MLPHELVPHFRNSIPEELLQESSQKTQDSHISSQWSYSSFSSIDENEQRQSSSSEKGEDRNQNASRASSIHDLLNPITPSESNCGKSFESHTAENSTTQPSQSTIAIGRMESIGPARECKNQPATSSTRSKKHLDDNTTDKIGEFARKLACNTITAAHSVVGSEILPVGDISSEKLPALDLPASSRKRSFDMIEEVALPTLQSSAIRLSMTPDGVVKVKTTDEETPSPPKQRVQSLGTLGRDGLRRSHSAFAAGEMITTAGQRDSERSTYSGFGRSRDARTWEFYCDVDVRSALCAQAENENNGSAVGAINLIRSQSQNARSRAQQKRKDTALKPKIGGRMRKGRSHLRSRSRS